MLLEKSLETSTHTSKPFQSVDTWYHIFCQVLYNCKYDSVSHPIFPNLSKGKYSYGNWYFLPSGDNPDGPGELGMREVESFAAISFPARCTRGLWYAWNFNCAQPPLRESLLDHGNATS